MRFMATSLMLNAEAFVFLAEWRGERAKRIYEQQGYPASPLGRRLTPLKPQTGSISPSVHPAAHEKAVAREAHLPGATHGYCHRAPNMVLIRGL